MFFGNLSKLNIQSGIECTTNTFSNDTKLSDVVDTPEGLDTIWRYLEKFENWVFVSLMWFSKARYEVLHLGRGSPQCHCRLGDEGVESSPAEDEKLNTSQQMYVCSPDGQVYPGMYPKKCVRQVKEGDSVPPLHADETSLEYCIQIFGKAVPPIALAMD